MLPEYTLLTVLGMLLVILAEVFVVKSGIFRRPPYWIALAICLGFQIPVDGYLTKLSNPIVRYNPDTMTGIRFPWDIPIEDFGFGWAMLTVTIMTWQALKNRRAARDEAARDEATNPAPHHGAKRTMQGRP